MRHIEFEAKLRYQEMQEEAEALKLLRQVPKAQLLRRFAAALMALADRLDPPASSVVSQQERACQL
ncbi:hypothetical protein [Deinococcus cellulosilyticus]|uniref:Uncharacterized protein n=1 Tax=Deinococcus cellulosilyticus (strain DSM 18568 / NBRC 106333 / KACC 11606 / 5516J-15) TaxID=1223518 RepID=A0A511MY24_DEIC1|nr:hypothetical protein [Deinococcus cellulosilyticus]GEM45036.1 hypothetical protein DC3_06710 [Deinococcus cellulosilyticus NBRC 106333 = KACC 11606]